MKRDQVTAYPSFFPQLRDVNQAFNLSPESFESHEAAEAGDVGHLALVDVARFRFSRRSALDVRASAVAAAVAVAASRPGTPLSAPASVPCPISISVPTPRSPTTLLSSVIVVVASVTRTLPSLVTLVVAVARSRPGPIPGLLLCLLFLELLRQLFDGRCHRLEEGHHVVDFRLLLRRRHCRRCLLLRLIQCLCCWKQKQNIIRSRS